MNYKSAIDYLNSFVNFERLSDSHFKTDIDDLKRFRKLLTSLGNPQYKFPVVHIVGTKGKGSTAAILTSVLRQAGYKVGLYTSPHLITVRERIRVDGHMISKQRFASLMQKISKAPESLRFGKKIAFRTVFEHLTAIALLEFAENDIDIAIVEAGLGARLDATNVIDPIISVLTPIGLDHISILGDTIEQIAMEKSYAIKKDVPAVSSFQQPEVSRVFAQRASEVGTSLQITPGFSEFTDYDIDNYKLNFVSSRSWLKNARLYLDLPGEFQLTNVSTAFSVLELLIVAGFKINQENVEEGLKHTNWQGRFQIKILKNITVIDGAHNTMGIEVVIKSMLKMFGDRKWRIVFAAHKNKPVGEMLEKLALHAEKIYMAPLQFPKSLDIETIKTIATEQKLPHEVFDNSIQAYKQAVEEASDEDIILVTGSLYLAGEIMRHFRELPPPLPDGRIDHRI